MLEVVSEENIEAMLEKMYQDFDVL